MMVELLGLISIFSPAYVKKCEDQVGEFITRDSTLQKLCVAVLLQRTENETFAEGDLSAGQKQQQRMLEDISDKFASMGGGKAQASGAEGGGGGAAKEARGLAENGIQHKKSMVASRRAGVRRGSDA
jgi:hypothetical protein